MARRAAGLLTEGGSRRILDIGSGVGKFCVVGALTTTQASFTGIEQRPHLVQIARDAAVRSGAVRARFIHANVHDFDFRRFDAVYLFNPFHELLEPAAVRIDDTIAPSPERHHDCVLTTYHRLGEMPPGTRVVTYGGFGAEMPSGFRCVLEEACPRNVLTLWVKE